MKKFFVMAALVGVALTSCMKNEVYVPTCDAPISFEVANYEAQTRVGSFDYDSFGVYAWSRDAAASSSVDMMIDETVSEVNGTWTTSIPYYWPINGTVDFIAYYPNPTTDEGKHKPTIGYDYNGADTFKYTDYIVDDVDLMYADKAIRFSANNDADGNGTNLGIDDYGFTGVPTLFHHALAKVNFKVKNAKPTDGIYSYDIKVNSITLNVYNQGSITLTNNGTGTASRGAWTNTTNNVWTPTDGSSKVNLEWTEDVTLSDGTEKTYNATKLQYVLPQTLAERDQTITVNYTVTQYQTIRGTKTKISEQTYTPTRDLYSTALPSWQMNKNITYTIELSSIGNQIFFAPAVQDWESDANGTVTIN